MSNLMRPIPREELERLASYVNGFAEAKDSEQLRKAAKWLEKASRHIFGQGFFGCFGGDECSSDHK